MSYRIDSKQSLMFRRSTCVSHIPFDSLGEDRAPFSTPWCLQVVPHPGCLEGGLVLAPFSIIKSIE